MGPTKARQLVGLGIDSLDMLRLNTHLLSESQRIGLQFVDDFQHRIPRLEVAQIAQQVAAVVASISADATMEVCGSYRRGKSTCGDIDVLIMHPEWEISSLATRVLAAVKAAGILTHSLSKDHPGADTDKHFGVCRLSPQHLHRRIDFMFVQPESWGCALLYFTGSDIFNRALRLRARRMGLHLDQEALRRSVILLD